MPIWFQQKIRENVVIFLFTKFQCSLGWCLYDIAGEHIEKPLKHYKMNLPDEWGMPLGWSLAFIPILIILGGLTFQMFWQCRGIPFRMVCNFKVSLSLSSSSHSILYLPTSIFIFELQYCMEKKFHFHTIFCQHSCNYDMHTVQTKLASSIN